MVGLLRTIAIVGGGFSGTVVAANLLRRPPPGPTRIVLIERGPSVGRGVAYAERRFPYLLNVPASRMSANSHAPREFLEFAQQRIPKATGDDFLPRALYGEYLQQVLLAAELSAPRNVRFEVWQGEVTGIRRLERHLPLHLDLSDGRKLVADDVVLAPGNPPPASLPAARAIADHPGYVADPWSQDLKFARHQTVLLIGTGLTMADIVNVASTDRHTTPKIHALSRHGLLPPRQTPFRPEAFRGDGNAGWPEEAPFDRILAFTEDFAELAGYMKEPLETYSTGMRARLAFGLSLAIDFDCYLIDEVILVGDQRFHRKCQDELFGRRSSRSLILASHATDIVREFCTHALVLKEGRGKVFEDMDLAIQIYAAL